MIRLLFRLFMISLACYLIADDYWDTWFFVIPLWKD